MSQSENPVRITREREALEKLWHTIFGDNFTLHIETLVAASILSASYVVRYYESLSLAARHKTRTLDGFSRWLADGRATMLGKFRLANRKFTAIERDTHVSLLAISVGHANMMLTCYTELGCPYGRSVAGLYDWLQSDTERGAVSVLTDALKRDVQGKVHGQVTDHESLSHDLALPVESTVESAVERNEIDDIKETPIVTESTHKSLVDMVGVTDATGLESWIEWARDSSIQVSYECRPYDSDAVAAGNDNLNDEFQLVLGINGRSIQISLLMSESNELARIHQTVWQRLEKILPFLVASALTAHSRLGPFPQSTANSDK